MAQELIDKIRAAAQAKGIDPEVALGIARAESGLDPNAKAKSSTAAGLFQILNNTWSGNKGAPGKQFDPDENIRVGTDIISKNVQSLRSYLGRDPSPKEVYAAHYFGASGARDFLSAAPDTPTSKIFSEKVLAANPNLKNKTAAQVLAQLEGKLKIPASNVSRETKQAQTEPTPAEEVMTKALPAGTTASVSRGTMMKGMPDIKSLPASYQAAFALAALADAKDDEKEDEEDDRKPTETEKFFASYKPVNHLASLDLSVEPIAMKDGGEVDSEEDVSKPFFGNPNISRQAGQARRNAAIQKASYRDEVAEAKDTARKGEAYQELERYLQSRDAVPNIKVTSYLPEGTHGLFSSDRTNIGTGTIKVNKNVHETYMPSTIAHEMTHAADRQMMQQAKEQGMFGNSNQFTQAYEKMVGPEGRNRTQLLRKRYPEFEEDNRYYRADPKELVAHAIGAYSGPVLQDRAPRHVDATAATELRILMDLAQRNVDKGPTGLAKIPAFFKRIGSYADGGPVYRADGSPKEGERKLDRETIALMRGEGMQPAAMQRVKPPLELNPSAAGLPGLMMYNDPSLPGTGTAGYVMMGDDSAKNPAMAQAMFLNPKEGNNPDTIAHETEHLLARQNLGRGSNINTKFDELIGDNGLKRIQFVQKAVQAAPYLKEKYGLQSAYFTPEMVEFQGRRAKNLLYEQLASLSALEQRHKIDLTKDEELRKTLFARPDVRETYNALTGLRQTRLDPRDLPPHTRVPEPGMFDAIKGVFKRADGGPVYRADGSPEEGERLTPQQIERLAMESNTPATVNPNIQKQGEAARRLAAMRDVNTLPDPKTYAVASGLLGTPPDQMGFSVMHPKAAEIKAVAEPAFAAGTALQIAPALQMMGVGKAAGKTGEAAKMLARDFQQYNQQLEVPGASYAVRNKGTPVAMTGLPFLPNVDEAEKVVKAVTIGQRAEPLAVTDKSLNDWFSKTVTRYLRSDFASPQDQLVRAAEEGKMLHLAPKEFSDSAEDQLLKHFLERRQSDLEYMRQAEGFGNTNMATQPYAQRIEDITDISAYPEMVGDLTPNRVPPSMRNIVETQPETRVTDFAPNIVENLKLEALRDKMLDVRQSDGKYGAYGQPAVKIPSEFMLPDDTLSKLNVAAASNRMARYTRWQDETRQKMATTALRADPTFPRAQLQEGKFIGVELPDIKKNPEIKQLVTDVGCDGGWCTRYTPNAEAYASGFSRLHMIVTGEGKQARPVAQFAIADSGPSYDTKRFSITEVKEKGNTVDFANNPALPAIQEYIQFLDKKYGGLDYVDNLKGLRMTALPEYPMQLLDLFNPTVKQRRMLENKYGSEENGFRAVRDKAVDLNNGSRFMTGNEDKVANTLEQAMESLIGPKENLARQIQMNLFGLPKQKATGGMIERQPTDNRRYL